MTYMVTSLGFDAGSRRRAAGKGTSDSRVVVECGGLGGMAEALPFL
jgi:hypothetical protein